MRTRENLHPRRAGTGFGSSAKRGPASESSALGSALLGIIVFILGLFIGVAAARADEAPLSGAKYVSLYAKVVKFPGETDEHATRRITRIIGEANHHALEHLIQMELEGVEFVPAPQSTTMFTILRDLVNESQGQFGSGQERRMIFLFTTEAYGGQEGLAMLGSGCSNFAAGIVASKGFQSNLLISAARTLAHEFLHVWGAAHHDHLIQMPDSDAVLPSLMHSFAVGSFVIAQESLDQIRNYVGSILPESNCLRDSARVTANSGPPALALTAPITMNEGESKVVQVSLPGLAPDFESCSMEYDRGTLPFYTGDMQDAVTGDISLSFPLDLIQLRDGKAFYNFKIHLDCSSYSFDQNYQVEVADFNLAPVVVAPQTLYQVRPGQTTRVVFYWANPPQVGGAPAVSCSGLPRGSRLSRRGNSSYFSIRPTRNSTVSCQVANAYGSTPVQFSFTVKRPAPRARR